EDQFGPLRTTSVFERNDAKPREIEEGGELLHAFERSFCWFERSNPRIPVDVEADMARGDDVAGGKRGAANHEGHVFGEDFLVANSILHGTHGAAFAKQVSSLLNGRTRMHALGGDDAEIALRNLAGI